MILGIGTDIIDITRVGRVYEKHGERFLNRVFTPEERRYAEASPPQFISRLAKRFAAKEACAKALGTGLGQGVGWRDIGVVRGRFGPPTLELRNKALERVQMLTPPDMEPQIHISLTDDAPLALAFVVISAVKR